MSSVMIPATFAEPFPLTLNVQGFTGGQTGLTPTVAIRAALTTNLYLDFNDLTFKTSGFTTRDADLTEIADGRYVRTAGNDPYLWTLAANQPPEVPAYFVAEFRVPNQNGEDDQIVVTANLPGEEITQTLDVAGNDAAGWQEVQTNRAGREIRRLNLFDKNGRITLLDPDALQNTVVLRQLV